MSPPPIQQQLSVAFLTWRRHLQRQLVPHEITLKQFYVLQQLARRAYLYPSQIAEMLYCDRPTATVVIRNMAREGWVTRDRDEQDRRQVRVAITAQGRRKWTEVERARQGARTSASDLIACFDEAEVAALSRLLSKLNAHLARLADGDASREREIDRDE